MKDKIDNIKNLAKNFTIETTPKVYKKISKLSDILERNTSVYITYLPDENSKKIIDTARNIKDEGLEPIPHLPARTLENFNEVEKYLGTLSENAGVKKVLIIGGGGVQKGNIESSMQVLKTGFIDKFNYKEVGLAGHPEGNPDINDKDLDKAIIEKNEFAKNTDAKLYLVTQFFFESKSFEKWEKHLFELGNNIEIHAGLPGPANLQTLISFAKSCGIGNSLRFLTKQALRITKIASTKTPGKLIYDLSNYKTLNKSSKLSKLHFYPFGGMKKTASWVNALINNELIIDEETGVRIDNFEV